jgi:hypothetical protein
VLEVETSVKQPTGLAQLLLMAPPTPVKISTVVTGGDKQPLDPNKKPAMKFAGVNVSIETMLLLKFEITGNRGLTVWF